MVDWAMFQHHLLRNSFKPTNFMNKLTYYQAPAQAVIEDFNGISQKTVVNTNRSHPRRRHVLARHRARPGIYNR